MNFQWNNSGSDRQVGDRTQSMPHWSTNQEQYGQGNIPTNQYNAFQTSEASTSNWNTGASYNQWCSSSQEQMNWPCSSYPSNPYNQVMQGNFTPNVYPNYSQSKSNYRENFNTLYDESERSNSFDYQMTNSLMTGQTNTTYGMPQSSYVSNCQDSNKLCGNLNTTTNNFSYWDTNRNGEQTMSYVPHPLYSTNRAACGNVSTSNLTMKMTEMNGNHLQDDMLQNFNKDMDLTQHTQIMKPNATNPRFSNSPPSNFFMSMMSHDNGSSNLSPVSDSKKQNYFDSFNSMNSSKVITSSFRDTKFSNTNINSPGNYNFDNVSKIEPPMTRVPKKEESRFEEIIQGKIIFIGKRILEKSAEFEKIKAVSSQTNDEKTYGEMYHLITEIKALECEMENIESEIRMKNMGHNVPSYIDQNELMPSFQGDCGLSGRDENMWSSKTISIKSLRQHLCKLKELVSQHLNVDMKPELLPDGAVAKTKRPEEQTDSAVATKSSSVRQVRRAVLKYLLKVSSQIENCFRELRNVKKMLKDDPNDREQEVIEILQRVGMHINQSRLSLKEKKKLCAKSNIRLRSLTIKSTGTNILQTLESDMYHLRKFYTALNHIARHLGTIERVPQDHTGPKSSSSNSLHAHSTDDGIGLVPGDETKNKSPVQGNSSSAPHPRAHMSTHSSAQMKRSLRDACLNGPPQKSARFMLLERRFWDKLMEVSYQIRSKILALRQAERSYKNGVKGSLPRLRNICEARPKALKRDIRLLIESKKKNQFSRHIPSYILESYPEQERRSRDKITLKSVRKNLSTFMSLCYSTRVLIKGDSDEPIRQEAKFWKRIATLMQKIQLIQSELSKLKVVSSNRHNTKSLDSIIRIEAKIQEIRNEIEKEEICRQKNGFSDTMPTNTETQKRKLNFNECGNMHVLRESFQRLKATLLELKSPPVTSLPSVQLSSATTSQNRRILPLPAETCDVPSDLAQFLGDGGSGWL